MQSTNVPPDGQDYWNDEDPEHPFAEWQREVAAGETRAGYWEWAFDIRSLCSDMEGQPEV